MARGALARSRAEQSAINVMCQLSTNRSFLSRYQTGSIAMYIVDPGVKQDPVRRWSLPDRVFFACGACHILAYAFLKAYPRSGFAPVWIKPTQGFTGNHIVAVRHDL